MKKLVLLATTAVCLLSSKAQAVVRITEWMYSGTAPEFVEITNIGATPVDLTGWSFDDSSREPGSFSLSAIGVLTAGQSAIISEELTADDFHTEWGTPNTLKVAAGNTHNLGRGDEINIYDGGGLLVDRLTYDDQGAGNVAGPRTQFQSGNPTTFAALGANNASLWTLSIVGDAFGSFAAAQLDVGNPGVFLLVPEPAGVVLAAIGLGVLAARRQRAA